MTTETTSPEEGTEKDEKSVLTKIAETIGEVAAEISVKTEQVTGMASDAFEAVKDKVHDITAPKVEAIKEVAKQVAKKMEPKKVANAATKTVHKAIAKPVDKKAVAVKKEAKAVAKKVNKK